MPATPLTDVAQRLLANVDRGAGELAPGMMRLATANYNDPIRWKLEIENIFLKVPLLVALSIDIPNRGNFFTTNIADRPVITIRGDDGVARSFLNSCRHRGRPLTDVECGSGRRLICPYHAWGYDVQGKLVTVPDKEAFGEVDIDGLIELPTAERSGIIFAVLTPGAPMDIDDFLGDMADALVHLELDKMHRYHTPTLLDSGNWKLTADGYLDGYHIGFLHSANIGMRQINNRNTFDLYGPHVRLGFANKAIVEMRDQPVDTWNLPEAMSLVHYLFPNVSISGQPGRETMVSRLLPGPTVDKCTVIQHQYSRVPLDTDQKLIEIEERRVRYAGITGDEDFGTVKGITSALPALEDRDFTLGRNESGNQNLHRWVDHYVTGASVVPVVVSRG